MNKSVHQDFAQICRQLGWKCTNQRLAVYKCVSDNHTHPDVDTVWSELRETLPSITRESVYRILNEFVEHGLLLRLDKIDRARYDSHTGIHGHYICEECGSIRDFELPEALKVATPQALDGSVKHIELRISGICDECQKKHHK